MDVALIDNTVTGDIAEEQSHRGGCCGQIISLVVVDVGQADGDVTAITNNMSQMHNDAVRIARIDAAAVELATTGARSSHRDNVVIENKNDLIKSPCIQAAALDAWQRNIKIAELGCCIR